MKLLPDGGCRHAANQASSHLRRNRGQQLRRQGVVMLNVLNICKIWNINTCIMMNVLINRNSMKVIFQIIVVDRQKNMLLPLLEISFSDELGYFLFVNVSKFPPF